MLGKTAGGLFWMFRYLERCENTARLVEAGFRIALTRSADSISEWKSVLTTAGVKQGYEARYDEVSAANVVDYLLRDVSNPSSVVSSMDNARTNARLVRTALTTEVWEAVNESWMTLRAVLKKPIKETDLPEILRTIRLQCALVRGALHGTMMRNDIFDFAMIGISLERADNTARIVDVKYYTLLPSASYVGSSLDNVQWETVLRSVSGHRSFRWMSGGEMTAAAIANFLILDSRFPRSLAFCVKHLTESLDYLAKQYGAEAESHTMARGLRANLKEHDINDIFEIGLHPFIEEFISSNNRVGTQIEADYRFTG